MAPNKHSVDTFAALFDSDSVGGNVETWSPNQFRYIMLYDDYAEFVDFYGDSDSLEFGLALTSEDLVEVFKLRRLGCLEGIYLSANRGGAATARQFASIFPEWTRMHKFGALGDEGIVSEEELPGREDWHHHVPLQPEHYPADEAFGTLHRAILASTIEEAGVEGSWEVEEPEETGEVEGSGDVEDAEDDARDNVTSYYTDSVRATIKAIIREYDHVFASGYGVITPAGVLMENSRGYGVLGHLKGEKLVQERVERNLQFLYERIKSEMNLIEVPVRNIPDIANVIVKGHTLDGTVYNGTPYFPYKMLEYAYGRERMDPASGDSLEVYEPHADSAKWEGYAAREVYKSLEDIIHHTLWVSLVEAGFEDAPESREANQVADDLFDKFKRAFCTCLLVTSFDVTNGNLVTVKLRILDPTNAMPRNRNLVADVLSESHGSLVGNSGVLIYPPKVAGEFFVEYGIDLDKKLANAEPLFAYKALLKVREQGGEINFENSILGKDADDNIVQNGKGISFSRNLSHLCIAGSRAGKGVWTFSILGSSILSNRIVPYLDNKPDMASTFLKYGPNGFVLNGANITYDKEGGTDYFGQFRDVDSWVDKSKIPVYLASTVGSGSYSEMGAYVYAKGLILSMGIIAARVLAPQYLDKLGGEQGVTIVVDELANANSGFMGFMDKLGVSLANTGYYQELKGLRDEGSTKKPQTDKPTKAGYWAAHVYERVLRDSLVELHTLSNAGLKNSEAARSDIFVLTQEPPMLVTNSGEAMELFIQRNKGKNGSRTGIANSQILPSFALIGGTDAFVGYDKDHEPGFLAQKNPSSPAYPYLNAEARNFAYIPSYGPDTPGRVNNAEFGRNRLYYKPFLLFADGDQNAYFVKNALKVAKDAGIPDTSVIIERNSVDGDPTTINPAVGFAGYLDAAGVEEPDLAERLNRSGEVAQFITDKLGYPGTWRDLILDMRPEWQFGIKDIITAVRDGVPMQDTVKERLFEFLYVYPEEFPGFTDGNSVDKDGNLDFSGWSNSEDPAGDVGGESIDDEPEFIDQGDDWADARGGGGGVPFGGNGNTGNTGNPGNTGAPNRTATDDPFHTYDDTIGAEGAYYSSPEERVGNNSGDTVQYEDDSDWRPERTHIPNEHHDGNTEDLTEELVVEDWQRDGDEAEEYLRRRQAAGAYGDRIGSTPFGKDIYPLSDGKAYRMGPLKILGINIGRKLNVDNPSSINTLMSAVTSGAYAVIGGAPKLNSLRVLDGTLIVNNTRYKPSFNDQYLASMPVDLRYEVQNGKVARLFNWQTLKVNARGVKRLYFDDVTFVADYVSDGLGWRGRISVDDFFSEFTQLQSLTIDDKTFKRSTYKADLRRDSTFYQPVATRRFADALDRAGVYGAKGSVGWMQRGLRRSDIGMLAKTGYVVAGLTGAALAGSMTATAKGGKVTGTGLRTAVSRIRDMMLGQ